MHELCVKIDNVIKLCVVMMQFATNVYVVLTLAFINFISKITRPVTNQRNYP